MRHTETANYDLYIYIYREREREREQQQKNAGNRLQPLRRLNDHT